MGGLPLKEAISSWVIIEITQQIVDFGAMFPVTVLLGR